MNLYAASGVDTEAGDRAVELMKASVAATHSANVLGGVGGFSGLFDVAFLKDYRHPVLTTSTDGVGTKVDLARQLDLHDTIGQDLVAMVVDDIVVSGARPLFMTDYIACGHVVPERIAAIVGGIAAACLATGTSLVGGEVAEHPDLLGADEYDVAGAATGVVERDRILTPDLVQAGDVLVGMAASGFHSNGYSLVRKVIADAGWSLEAEVPEFGRTLGEQLLEPTRLYTAPLLAVLDDPDLGSAVHTLSHITGGGIAANLARVLPRGLAIDVDRSTWNPGADFRVLAGVGGFDLTEAEGTWNLGMGMAAIVAPEAAAAVIERLGQLGVPAWVAGEVTAIDAADAAAQGYVQGAKGVAGGAVRLVGGYATA